jgi:hemerythrin superfamily protein
MPRTNDAIELLTADHREVEQLFAHYEKLARQGEDDQKMLVAAQICASLEVHARIEEEVFYPASRQALKDQDAVDEAVVEHAGAKKLISEIEGMSSAEPLYDAKVKVLSEYIKHHVREEETTLFPMVRKTSIDLQEVGRRLADRKQALTVEAGATSPTSLD